MNPTTLNFLRIAFAIYFIGFGIDKFVQFLPTCSLTPYISDAGMIATGVLEIILGLAILLKKQVLLSLKMATGIIIGGLAFHLFKGTYDIGGGILGIVPGLLLIFAYEKNKE